MVKKNYPVRYTRGRVPVCELGETVRIKYDVGNDLFGRVVGGKHPNYVLEIPQGALKLKVRLGKRRRVTKKKKDPFFDIF